MAHRLTYSDLNVDGFAWFFAAADRFEPNAGPYRITCQSNPSTLALVGIAPLADPDVRRFVPLSRLELRRLLCVVSD